MYKSAHIIDTFANRHINTTFPGSSLISSVGLVYRYSGVIYLSNQLGLGVLSLDIEVYGTGTLKQNMCIVFRLTVAGRDH